MWILLYMKPMWSNGFPEIYVQLEELGSICHGYMWIPLYMKLIWCKDFQEIYVWLEEELGSICHGYMCIVLYRKLIWCNGFPEIYGWLEEGGMGSVCTGVLVFHRSIGDWRRGYGRSIVNLRRGWGLSAMGICEFCYIWNLFCVMVFQKSMLEWREVHLT